MSFPARLAALLAVLLAVPPGAALAQVVVNPNQVVGTVGFTNANPEILAILEAPPSPGSSGCWWDVGAKSIGLPLQLTASTTVATPTREPTSYELTVESSGAGIAYGMAVVLRANDQARYAFASIPSAPVAEEPAPDVVVEVRECAALARFGFATAAGEPSVVTGGSVESFTPSGSQAFHYIPAGATSARILVRGAGDPTTIRVRWTEGTDPESDLVTYQKTFDVVPQCDDVIDLECRGSGADDWAFGRILGTFDVLGEEEHDLTARTPASTTVSATGGPWGNHRKDVLRRSPSSGAFELERLVPSPVEEPPAPYRLTADFALRTGRSYEEGALAFHDVLVGSGETVDIGNALVMDPARISGAVIVAAPPPEPPLGSVLDHLVHVDSPGRDADGDGIPDDAGAYETASRVQANGVLPYSDWARLATGFTGDRAPGLEALLGDYELVLPAPGEDQGVYTRTMALRFERRDMADGPRGWMSSFVQFSQDAPRIVWLPAGARAREDYATCLGLVHVTITATHGTFFAPSVRSEAFVPPRVDFRGRAPVLASNMSARGTPLTESEAAATGLVVTPLPAGHHVLRTTVTTLNPGGGTSLTAVTPIELDVGCRQVLTTRPEVALSLGELAPCADSGRVPLRATIRAASPIARAWVSVNGAPPVDACAPCGTNPVVETSAVLEARDNVVTVGAVDESGLEATAMAVTRFVREPSALDRDPSAEPLRVSRSGDDLRVTWQAVAGQAANVHRGTIESLWTARAYDHRSAGPCLVDDGTATLPVGSGSSYFLVAAACEWGEAVPGRDSVGRPRPLGLEQCR